MSESRFATRPTAAFVPSDPPPRTVIDSSDLLGGAREIVIRHGDSDYRLRHTQNDKLILTK